MLKSGTIFIQPHSDDTVMSSYFLIAEEILPRPYYLLTVFGKSNWIDPIKKKQSQYRRNDEETVTRIRKIEDEKFSKAFGLTLLFSDFKDCLLRDGKVYYSPGKKSGSNLIKETESLINNSIKRYKIKNVVAPSPSGRRQHYDHRIVYEAVRLLPAMSCNKFFVDDLPYGRITNLDKLNLRCFTQVRADNIHDKFRAMKIYDSQMCKLFFDQVSKITIQNKKQERLFTTNSQ